MKLKVYYLLEDRLDRAIQHTADPYSTVDQRVRELENKGHGQSLEISVAVNQLNILSLEHLRVQQFSKNKVNSMHDEKFRMQG